MTLQDPRRRDLAKIHLARKQLGLDEVQYRALIHAAGSATGSSANLDAAGLALALEQFRRLGWKPVKASSSNPFTKPFTQADRIRWLWRKLGEAEALKEPSEKGLDAFIQALTGVSSLQFIGTHQANKVIEALKSWLLRATGSKTA